MFLVKKKKNSPGFEPADFGSIDLSKTKVSTYLILFSPILEVIKFVICQQDEQDSSVNSNLVSTFRSSQNNRRNRLWSVSSCLCSRFDELFCHNSNEVDWSGLCSADGRQTLTKDLDTYSVIIYFTFQAVRAIVNFHFVSWTFFQMKFVTINYWLVRKYAFTYFLNHIIGHFLTVPRMHYFGTENEKCPVKIQDELEARAMP